MSEDIDIVKKMLEGLANNYRIARNDRERNMDDKKVEQVLTDLGYSAYGKEALRNYYNMRKKE